ncbi:MAG: Spermidine/putrescine import ATP-binding protein PotA [Pseudomonadota bacterium]|jgi:iron(III) transport system ATP-binding protein
MSWGIELRQVTKRYGDASSPLVVQGIDLRIRKGSLTTLLGPSGCGKTTTLRMVAGLEAPSSGQILIDGQDVTALGPSQRDVSMVFQSYALFPHMNVIDNVSYGLVVQGVDKRSAHERARATLELVGLSGFDTRWPGEMSGGQQQRVAVARSLILEPSVMLFDEPLSNLDAALRRSMREDIRALQQRLSLTVAYVTHDQSEAMAVSDQIVVMDKGCIAQQGTPRELYEAPASAFVADFMGEAMIMDAHVDAQGCVRLGPLQAPARQATAPGPVKVAVRPQAWTVDDRGASGLPGKVLHCAYLGAVLELKVRTELGDIFVVCNQVRSPWAVDSEVSLQWTDQGVSVLPA